ATEAAARVAAERTGYPARVGAGAHQGGRLPAARVVAEAERAVGAAIVVVGHLLAGAGRRAREAVRGEALDAAAPPEGAGRAGGRGVRAERPERSAFDHSGRAKRATPPRHQRDDAADGVGTVRR